MKPTRASLVLLVGAIGLVAGCGPRAEGDWDGTVNFLSVLGSISLKDTPAHVRVAGDAVTVTGAPFTTCAVKLGKRGARGEFQLVVTGDVCKFHGEKGKEFAISDGGGWMIITGDDAEFTIGTPVPAPSSGKADVSFTLKAHRVGK